jgi:hypothetical protein
MLHITNIRERQIKTIMRHSLTSVRMKSYYQKDKKYILARIKGNTYPLGGNVN